MTTHRLAATLAALTGAVALGAAAGCSGDAANAADDPTADLPRVASQIAYAALPLGIAEGIFDEHFQTDTSGLSIQNVAAGIDGFQAVSGGHIDIAIGGYANGVFLSDPDLRIIGVTEQSPRTHAVLVPPDSDIDEVADLAGLTLGGYSAQLPAFVSQLFEHEGIAAEDVDYIQVANDAGLTALTSGAIDAWYTWDPYFAQSELEGLVRPIIDGVDFYLNPVILVTSRQYIDEHADSVRAFVEAYAESTDWMNDHREETVDYLTTSTGMTAETASTTLDRREYEVQAPTGETRAWIEDLIRIENELGVIDGHPDLDTIIDDSFVATLG